MFKKVLLSCVLLAATDAYAEEQVILGSACYTQGAMRDIVGLSEDDQEMLILQYLRDGMCAPIIMSLSDWQAGVEIRDTGVKAAYASVYNWARTDGAIAPPFPPKQVMYFDAGADFGAAD